MTNTEVVNYIGEKYNELKERFAKFCNAKHYEFDEDVFAETICRVLERLQEKRLNDETYQGIENFIFKAFKINTMREKLYARNLKRDLNFDADDEDKVEALDVIENPEMKIKSDAFKDYQVYRLLEIVEQNFDTLDFRIFRMKYLVGYTFKKIRQITKINDCNKRVRAIEEWLRNNVKKDEILNEFEGKYQQIV